MPGPKRSQTLKDKREQNAHIPIPRDLLVAQERTIRILREIDQSAGALLSERQSVLAAAVRDWEETAAAVSLLEPSRPGPGDGLLGSSRQFMLRCRWNQLRSHGDPYQFGSFQRTWGPDFREAVEKRPVVYSWVVTTGAGGKPVHAYIGETANHAARINQYLSGAREGVDEELNVAFNRQRDLGNEVHLYQLQILGVSSGEQDNVLGIAKTRLWLESELIHATWKHRGAAFLLNKEHLTQPGKYSKQRKVKVVWRSDGEMNIDVQGVAPLERLAREANRAS